MENKSEVEKKYDHIKDVISTINLNSLDDSLIKDNKLYFEYDGKSYRVKMPSQKDISDAHRRKDQHQCQLMSDKCPIFTKETLKRMLKENQNINIDELEAQRIELQQKLQDIYLDLAIIHPDSTDRIEDKKIEIRELDAQFTDVFMTITRWLEPALENQLEKVYVEFLTSRCCEVEIKTEKETSWLPIWLSYDAFQNDNNNLTSECIKQMTFLLIKTNR